MVNNNTQKIDYKGMADMGNGKDSQEMVVSPVLGFPLPMRPARLLSTQKMFTFAGRHCWALEAVFSIAC